MNYVNFVMCVSQLSVHQSIREATQEVVLKQKKYPVLYISQLFCGKGDSLINGNVIMIIVIMNGCNLTNCVFAGNFPYTHTT